MGIKHDVRLTRLIPRAPHHSPSTDREESSVGHGHICGLLGEIRFVCALEHSGDLTKWGQAMLNDFAKIKNSLFAVE